MKTKYNILMLVLIYSISFSQMRMKTSGIDSFRSSEIKSNSLKTYNYKLYDIDTTNIKVCVYIDKGVFESCGTSSLDMFHEMQCNCTAINKDSILNGALNHYTLLFMPGGDMWTYQNYLGSQGMDLIEEYVKHGGGYIGICGGAYFASYKVLWHGWAGEPRKNSVMYGLNLFSGTAEGPIDDFAPTYEISQCQIKLTNKSHLVSANVSDTISPYYHHGPQFLPDGPQIVSVIGKTVTGDKDAIIALNYYLGKVFLMNSHPEFDAARSSWEMIRNAVKWCSLQSVAYFGQTLPGDTAVIFAPGLISLPDRNETNITFSPDGNEVYLEGNDGIYFTKCINNAWTQQMKEPIFNGFGNPVFSANGNKMYLTKWSSDYSTSDIWMSERNSTVWSAPQILPAPINSSAVESGYSETNDSVLYFSSNRSGTWNIWCVRPSSNQAENLGSVVNSPSASDPCIAHDGSYLIFWSDRPGSIGVGDLYVSFNKGNNLWTAPINMESNGVGINSAKYNVISPSLSPDGKFLFMNRHSFDFNVMPDIYWVSTHILVGLKKAAYAPKLGTQINDITIKTDSTLSYIIPSGTFSCEYGTDGLRYSAALSDGSALPSWLTFNRGTRTLSGTPKEAGIFEIKITVTNADIVSASCTFKIAVANVTGIEDENGKLPMVFKLNQNYPNPFNPTTVISYQLPLSGNVKLTIFDLLGQKVNALINSYQSKGEHSIVWNGTDDSNNPVSSGIYFYRLDAGKQSFKKKMILVR